MDSQENRSSICCLLASAPTLEDAPTAAGQRLGRRRAQGDDKSGSYEFPLPIQPPSAMRDFARVGTLVDSAFAARAVLEVLDGIRDEDVLTINAGGLANVVEELSCRTDEGPPGKVFAVSWLLSDEHQICIRRSFTHHDVGCMTV